MGKPRHVERRPLDGERRVPNVLARRISQGGGTYRTLLMSSSTPSKVQTLMACPSWTLPWTLLLLMNAWRTPERCLISSRPVVGSHFR